ATKDSATIIADLRRADAVGSGSYDCVILTQVLQFIDEIHSTLAECSRILRPGGTLLVTAPCITRVDVETGPDGDYWRLTEALARKQVAAGFSADAFQVSPFGHAWAGRAVPPAISA